MNIVRSFITMRAVILGAVMIPIFAAVMLVILAVVPPIFTSVGTVSGPGGFTSDGIQFGAAHLVLGIVGALSIPASIALMLFLSGKLSGGRKPPRRGI